MNFDFLKKVQLIPNEIVEKPARAKRLAEDLLPTSADLRVYKDGSIYPSKAFSEMYSLDYVNKSSAEMSFGIDIFKSSDYANTATIETPFLLAAIVSKKEPKVDIFGATRFSETGDPLNTVFTQGANTFGKNLLQMIEEVYEISNQEFVDLSIVVENQLVTTDGFYFVPKSVNKGARKGEKDISVRKDIQLFPIAPVNIEELPKATVEENEDTEEEYMETTDLVLSDTTDLPTKTKTKQ